jgi:C_GCAxxG_C_C family probable redox protein
LKANKAQVLDRVQKRAEENNYYLRNCPQSTAMALMEEFGMGNMEIIKALTPFPGIGSTGRICGGVSGSLIAFGLFFGSDSPPDPEKTARTIQIAQKFIASFEDTIGYLNCSDIIRTMVIGRALNPGESAEAMADFTAEKGFEKCCLLPGQGARLAAGFIIDNMK